MDVDEAAALARLSNHARANPLHIAPAYQRAVIDYQGGGHRLVNRIHWLGTGAYIALSDAEAGRVRAMTDALTWLCDRFGSPGLVVWRGLGSPLPELTPGEVLLHKGFASTSVHVRVARSFATGVAGMLRISIPVGSPSAWLAPYGDPMWAWQQEVVLPRACRILVHGRQNTGSTPVIHGEVLA